MAQVTATDQALNESYTQADCLLRLRASRIGCILCVVLVPAGSLLDWVMYPAQFVHFLILRLVTSGVILAILALHWSRGGQKAIRILNLLWVLTVNLAITLMILLAEDSSSPYYAGLNLLILGMGVLLPLTVAESLFACIATLVMYTASSLIYSAHGLDGRMLFNNLYFLILTSIICVTSSHFNSRRRFEDFTLRHQLDARNHELNQSYLALAQMDRLRSQFFANISHELRTPLTLIIAPIEDLLRSGQPLSDSMAEALGIARANALRLLKLINDLLELVRLDERGATLHHEIIEIATFSVGVVESIRYLAEAKGLTLSCQPCAQPVLIHADPARMEKILLNLLTNAIKFTPRGGTIGVTIAADDQHALIEVTDSGIGIPAAALPHIFDRFHQVDGSSTRKYQGAGIGLALVKSLVEEHKGSITAHSGVGQGTSMRIMLPLHLPQAVAAPHPLPADRVEPSMKNPAEIPSQAAGTTHAVPALHAAGTPAPQATEADDALSAIYRSAERRGGLTLDEGVLVEGMRLGSGQHLVLVVDDEPDMRRYLVSRLIDEYSVIQSDHGERALALAQQQRPDLILLDLMLPGMDGIQLCRALRSDPGLAQSKIILLTARMDEASKISALESGADDFLTKPFSTIEIKTRLAGQLRTLLLQREVQERATMLAQALAKLKETESQLVHSEKMNSLGTIAAGLLHEVNNPLNYTLTALQVGHGCIAADSPLKEILDDIGQGMQRIKTIVTDLGMFAYKSGGSDQETIDLRILIDASTRLISHELTSIQLECEVPPGTLVMGAKTQLSHVFMNLLINSVKALKSVTGRQPAIRIAAALCDGRMMISVHDNGIGIAPEVLPRIFEPFFTTRAIGQGTGLGLSICHTIVANHGGQIIASSEPGRGTTMQFSLALAHTLPSHDKDVRR